MIYIIYILSSFKMDFVEFNVSFKAILIILLSACLINFYFCFFLHY